MARKILIASGKGGVGKSTISAALGRAFARKNKKTLLVDCDSGLSSLDILLNCREFSSFSWYDAYLERCSPEECVTAVQPSLFLINSPQNCLREAAENSITSIVEELEEDYEFVILDAPAGLDRGLVRAAKAASQAIVVAVADEISVQGATRLENTIRSIGITRSRLLINRYDLKAAKKGKLLTVDEIIDKTLVRLIGIIPEDKEIMYSTVTGKISPKSKSERAFRRVADRIDGLKVEFSLNLLK